MVSMWLPPATSLLSREIPPPSMLQPAPQQYMLSRPLPAEPLSYYPSLSPTLSPTLSHTLSPTTVTRTAKPASPKSPAKKLFPCPYPNCTQTSSNKGNLSKHIATRHEHRKDFACPFKGCNRRFAKKYNMLRHLSASGVHRTSPIAVVKVPGKRRASDRAKWSSMELDLAKFLAEKCRPALMQPCPFVAR
ncbi:Metallothionein expression activator [Gracilariopsis chorda]|uniref:Metallothionein expression activator n=1 Tax=Gracilariopsis chorda TaxID=448386 RepID=A0A2V3IHD9_9FLOR|nr:Metallothionein expression activator [Gracilariopsis chorda]|eukprot:PXF41504.1 Metallothionein expression activator [Gracilariopsis chorda]